MFERAVELDPEFALAHARLSWVHSRLYWYGYDWTEARLARAKKAADRAFEIDPDLPELHQALGWYYYWSGMDYQRALEEFALAEKALPNNSNILMGKAAIQYRRMGKWEESRATLEKALELDPRNLTLLQTIVLVCTAMRRHEESDRYGNRLISMAPDQVIAYQAKAWNEMLWKDTETARKTLENMPETGDLIAPLWYSQEIYERNYRKALERLSSTPVDSFVSHFGYRPKSLLSGRAHDFLNEPDLARVAYEEAQLFLEKELQERPEDSRLHSSLGIAYAGLGRKEDAVREGERAVELLPVSKDSHNGTFRLQDLALIYAMVGEYDDALDQIDYLLSIPAPFTVKIVELDPSWDPLRKHPRYKEILEKYR